MNLICNWKVLPLILVLAVLIPACDFSDGEDPVVWNVLSSYQHLGTLTESEIREIYDDLPALINYDVDLYRLVYRTRNLENEQVSASGLVLVPDRETAPMLSLQRFTIFHEDQAPSNVDPNIQDNNVIWPNFAPVLASSGFLTVMPDFLGFGASRDLFHPYFVTDSHGRVAYDMLRAARDFVQSEAIRLEDELYLTGYSQGGTATLALLKEISEDPVRRFNVTKATAGGGGYNLLGLAEAILDQDELSFSPYYAFLATAYIRTYFPTRQLSTVFRSPYDDRIQNLNLFGGDYYSYEIMSELTNVTIDLFNRIFLNDFRGQGEVQFKLRLQDNDVSNFRILTPLRIYHGDADEVAPFEEAQQAYTDLVQAGSRNISFHQIEDGTHTSSVQEYASQTILWFLQ